MSASETRSWEAGRWRCVACVEVHPFRWAVCQNCGKAGTLRKGQVIDTDAAIGAAKPQTQKRETT